jgi:predicted protein tyrosine phosphatase
MATRVLVPFHGDGSGVGGLTWGQKGIWQTIQLTGESRTMGGITPLRPGATVERVAATLQFVLSRHESLRTRLRLDADGHAQQVVASAGELPMEIVDTAGTEDPADVAAAVRDRYEERNFDYVDEWPVRMALIRHRGVLTHAVAVYLHLAVDAHGLEALMLDTTRAGEPDPPPVTGIRPLELARQQQQPAALRQGEASLRHLEHVLRTVSPHRFGPPAGTGPAQYQQLGYTSPASLLAAQVVASATAAGTTPVLLAAFSIALARHTGVNPVLSILAVSNRFRPGFAGAVTPVAQVSPCLLNVAGVSLTEAVSRAARAAMHAYKHAYYDPDRRAELVARVNRERGEEVDISCFFNDRRQQRRDPPSGPLATEAEIRAALPASELRWVHESKPVQQKLYLDVNDAAGAIDLTMSADTRYLPAADMATVVRGIEAVLVAAAVTPGAPTGVAATPAMTGAATTPAAG